MGGGVEKEISRSDLEVKSKVVIDAIGLAKRKNFSETFGSYKLLARLNESEDISQV